MNEFERREFLKKMAAAGAYTSGLGFGALPAVSFGSSSCNDASGSNGVLVVIFQRGANDGMNMLAPNKQHSDPNAYDFYTTHRKVIAHSEETVQNEMYRVKSATGIESGFSIHPAMHRLKPMIDNGKVAFFPGTHVGYSPDGANNKMIGNMSHFTAQDIMELGGHGHNLKALYAQLNNNLTQRTEAGWIARSYDLDAIQNKPENNSFLKVFGFQANFALRGLTSEGFMVARDPSRKVSNIYAGGGDVSELEAYDRYYQSRIEKRNRSHASDNMLSNQWKEMQQQFFNSIEELSGLAYPDITTARQRGYKVITRGHDLGGRTVDTLSSMADYLSKTAVLINQYPELEVITINQGDYDTHSGQIERQSNLLDDLSQNLQAFHDDVTSGENQAGRPVEVLVITEFGRTFDDSANNPSGGTDHGQAFTAMTMSCGTSPGVTAPINYGRRLNYSLESPPHFERDLIFKSGARYYTRAIQDYRDIISEIMSTRRMTCRNPFVDADPDFIAKLPGFLKDTVI